MRNINIESFKLLVSNFYSFKELSNEQLFEILEVYNCLLVFTNAPGYDLYRRNIIKDQKTLITYMKNERKIL
jgi:hypothetical protein